MEKEFMGLAKMVVSEMVADGAKDAFMSLDYKDRAELSMAYLDSAIKKCEKMQTIYLTNPEARRAFQAFMLKIL